MQYQKRSLAEISCCKINIQRFRLSAIYVMSIMEGKLILELKTKMKDLRNINCDKVSKNGPSKICARRPLKKLKGYGLL